MQLNYPSRRDPVIWSRANNARSSSVICIYRRDADKKVGGACLDALARSGIRGNFRLSLTALEESTRRAMQFYFEMLPRESDSNEIIDIPPS